MASLPILHYWCIQPLINCKSYQSTIIHKYHHWNIPLFHSLKVVWIPYNTYTFCVCCTIQICLIAPHFILLTNIYGLTFLICMKKNLMLHICQESNIKGIVRNLYSSFLRMCYTSSNMAPMENPQNQNHVRSNKSPKMANFCIVSPMVTLIYDWQKPSFSSNWVN